MRRTLIAILCMLFLSMPPTFAEGQPPDLSFLSGQWKGFDYAGISFADLYWSKTKGETIVGCIRDKVAAERAHRLLVSILLISIGTNNVTLSRRTYGENLETELNQQEDFRSEEIKKNKVVFEDSTHQKRLIYERHGKKLIETEVPLLNGVLGKPIVSNYFKG